MQGVAYKPVALSYLGACPKGANNHLTCFNSMNCYK